MPSGTEGLHRASSLGVHAPLKQMPVPLTQAPVGISGEQRRAVQKQGLCESPGTHCSPSGHDPPHWPGKIPHGVLAVGVGTGRSSDVLAFPQQVIVKHRASSTIRI